MKGYRSNRTGVPLPCIECGEPSFAVHSFFCKKCRYKRAAACPSTTKKYPSAKAYSKKWRQENFTKYLVCAARSRSRRLGLPFDLKPEDVQVPSVCPVLGIELTTLESRERKDNLATLDRIVPSLGYVKGNVAIISWRANFLKCNGTLKELEAIVSWMREVA